jgi:acetoin utilization protein AcuB
MLLVALMLGHDDGGSAELVNRSVKKGNKNPLAPSLDFRISGKAHGYFLRNAKQALRYAMTSSNLQGKVMLIFGTPSALSSSWIMERPSKPNLFTQEVSGMKVVDVMTEAPVTVTPSETIRQADGLMDENNFRQIPVVNGQELVGIITDRDIRSFLSGSLHSSTEDWDKAMNTNVSTVMTTQPITVAPDDDLAEAVEILLTEKIGAVPVVDEAAGLVGILSYVDVLRCFLDRLQED